MSFRGQFCDLSNETIVYLNTLYCTSFYFLTLLNTSQYFMLLLRNFYIQNSDYYGFTKNPANVTKSTTHVTCEKIKIKTFAMSYHFLRQTHRFPAMLPTLTIIKDYPCSY